MRKRALTCAAFVLALLGCAICLVVLRMISALPGDSFTTAVCAPSARVNCEYVLASRWSRIGPVPTPVVGLAYYSVLAVWMAVIGAPNAAGRRWHLVPEALTFASACASAYLFYVMATALPVWCTWCLAGHAVNAALFIVVLFMRPPRQAAATIARTEEESLTGGAAPFHLPRPHPTTARAVGVLAGCGAMVLILALAVFAYRMQVVAWQFQLALLEAANNPDYVVWRWRESPVREIPVHEDDLSLGPADAPHTLVVFTDYECDMCAVFEPYVRRLREMMPAELRIVFKHYPVSTACNPNVTSAFHYYSCDAALAMTAARRTGTPEQAHAYHEGLFARSRDLATRPYDEVAERVGLDRKRFAAAMSEDATRDRLRDDIDLAYRLGVTGTPALFLDGRQLPNWRMVTTEPRPRIDVARTDELWRRLLAESNSK